MSVPDDFGEVGGTPIENKDSILGDINRALGRDTDSNPCVEYILSKPYGILSLPFGLGSLNYNMWGHSALRYTTPDGRDVVVNVEAKQNGKKFLQFYEAKEYLYGTDRMTSGAQRGTYHRDMVGVRVEHVAADDIERMHSYILELIEKDSEDVKFNLVLGPLLNALKHIHPAIPEYGNCARWTSSMLLQAGLVTTYFVWPKTIFINMFENYSRTGIKELKNMNVVYYEQPAHVARLDYGVKSKPVWFANTVAPMQSIRNYFYADMKSFARCVVTVPPDSMHAVVEINNDPIRPSEIRNILNSKYFIVSSLVGSVIAYRRGFRYLSSTISRWRNSYK